MKPCEQHRHLSREALQAAGLEAETYRQPGEPHTARSALRQVVQSHAYEAFGKRSAADDFCVFCEAEDPDAWLARCVEEVAKRRRAARNPAEAAELHPAGE